MLNRGIAAVACSAAIYFAPVAASAADAPPGWASDIRASARLTVEGTAFFRSAAASGQDSAAAAVTLEPRLSGDLGQAAWAGEVFVRHSCCAGTGGKTIVDVPVARLRAPLGADWTVTAGADVRRWQRAETVNYVDIINQIDASDGALAPRPLGQPMIAFDRPLEIGEALAGVSVLLMPYFRARRFAPTTARLRPAWHVEGGPRILASGGAWRPAAALRLDVATGPLDLGVTAFSGLSRTPGLQPVTSGEDTRYTAVYDTVEQVGIDFQLTLGDMLYKVEAIHRWDQLTDWRRASGTFERRDFMAGTVGVERVLPGPLGGGEEVGLIAEAVWDGRGASSPEPFADSLVLGLRVSGNDLERTSGLATLAYQPRTRSVSVAAEAGRDIATNKRMLVRLGSVLLTSPGAMSYDRRRDAYLRAGMAFSW